MFSILSASQSKINGTVTDQKGKAIEGANVYLEGTYDGTTTQNDGTFSFNSSETGNKTLIISYLTYETFTVSDDVSAMINLNIELKEDISTLDAVVLSAGSFSAGDNSKINALKPLDVVTTASALGDFVGALQTLPGTTTAAEDGRLFVRGGEAEETQIFIDGIRVFTPYAASTNNIPTRGRYSPFLFDGITFSTGGYSAEYGQALSSVLLLNTIDEPSQEKTDIGIMTVGGTVGHTEKWESTSLSVNGSYINLAPYLAVFDDRNDWEKPYELGAGETVFRKRFNNGLFKLYAAFDTANFSLTQEDINIEEGIYFNLKNDNMYVNSSYQGLLNDTWSVFGGMSYTFSNEELTVIDNDIHDVENSFHFKVKLKKRFSSRLKLNFGAEYFMTDFTEDFSNLMVSSTSFTFTNNIAGAFAEADIFFSKNLAFKAGIRGEYSKLFEDFTLSPRVSLAYKTSEKSQLSLAYGNFYQSPLSDVLKYNQNLENQNTRHYILNYQFNSDGRIFRAETYYKDYDNLIKYDSDFILPDTSFNNDGFGYATGLDLFWRDSKTVKNLDYWVSYSYLDTERDYRNFESEAQPNFANKHNLSIVGKYWVNDWKSQLGISYSFASGRTYTDPNQEGFLNQYTKPFNSISFNWAYLIGPQKILYFSVNNLLGFNNINGYQYANSPNMDGVYERRALLPAADQFFFIGFFWTISDDKTSNQLDNL